MYTLITLVGLSSAFITCPDQVTKGAGNFNELYRFPYMNINTTQLSRNQTKAIVDFALLNPYDNLTSTSKCHAEGIFDNGVEIQINGSCQYPKQGILTGASFTFAYSSKDPGIQWESPTSDPNLRKLEIKMSFPCSYGNGPRP
jgi:hypothetical protein